LIYAVEMDQNEMVALLIQKGASPNVRDHVVFIVFKFSMKEPRLW